MNSPEENNNLTEAIWKHNFEQANSILDQDESSIHHVARMANTPLHAISRHISTDIMTWSEDGEDLGEFSDDDLAEEYEVTTEDPETHEFISLARRILQIALDRNELDKLLRNRNLVNESPYHLLFTTDNANLQLLKLIISFCELGSVSFGDLVMSSRYGRDESTIHMISECQLPFSFHKAIFDALSDEKLEEVLLESFDRDKDTPLHWVLDREQHSVRRLRLYLDRVDCAKLLSSRNNNFETPLDKFASWISREEDDELRQSSCMNVLLAFSEQLYSDPSATPLHRAACLSPWIQLSLLKYIRLNLSRLSLVGPDSRGRYPIHVASEVNFDQSQQALVDIYTANMMYICALQPKAMEATCCRGQLPLHVSLSMGLPEILNQLMLNYNPLALNQTDPVSRCSPFHLACVYCNEGTVFAMLRKDPGLLSSLSWS